MSVSTTNTTISEGIIGIYLERHSSADLAGLRMCLLPRVLRVSSLSGVIFLRCFLRVSNSADGGTQSLGINSGETENPSKNMPRVVKMVFWRCVLLLLFSCARFRYNFVLEYCSFIF